MVHLSNSAAGSQQLVGAKRSAIKHPSAHPQLLTSPIPPANPFFFPEEVPLPAASPPGVSCASLCLLAGWLRAGTGACLGLLLANGSQRGGARRSLYLGRTDRKQQLSPKHLPF